MLSIILRLAPQVEPDKRATVCAPSGVCAGHAAWVGPRDLPEPPWAVALWHICGTSWPHILTGLRHVPWAPARLRWSRTE